MNVQPLTSEELNVIDPGVRNLVVWLRSRSFNTTDSGDGITKINAGNIDALDVPHVFMRVADASLLYAEALRLQYVLWTEHGIKRQPGRVEASYDPANGIAVLSLTGISDTDLRGQKT